MKYDGVNALGGGGEGNSHTLVMELVGNGKRVLDVGCSTGYLAQDLVQVGNRVSGVEIDAEAAEKARPFLEQLVIGDLDVMDLAEGLPNKSFDVIVFADVLEHLKDPVRTLRQSKALLDDGGYVVLSIPNIAHASVRLALLQGRFEYRPVGLLDETHLRFFTRSSLEDLLAEAGFVAKDVRRTTLPPFGTEIPLDPDDFDSDLLNEVDDDPESSTYQFVLTAVPAIGADKSVREELARLHEQVAVFTRALRSIPPLPTVGVASGEKALDQIRSSVVVAELRRRLDGVDVRSYTAGRTARPSELTGEPMYPLSEAGEAEPGVDAIVVTDPSLLPGDEHEAFDVSSWPEDPIGLAGRVLNPASMNRRARHLEMAGGATAPIILTDLEQAGSEEPLATLGRRRNAEVLRLGAAGAALDVAANVARADVVVASGAALAAMACGMGRPLIVVPNGSKAFARWAEAAGLAVGPVEALPSLGEDLSSRPTNAAREELWRDLDVALDDLATAVFSALARRSSASAPARISELARRVSVLEAVNAGLRTHLETLLGQPDGDAPPVSAATAAAPSSKQFRRTLAVAEDRAQHLQEEIDRIYATRLMRTVQPLRRVYGRFRSLRG